MPTVSHDPPDTVGHGGTQSPRYFGGPLDGRPAARFRGRWSTYRDAEGKHLPSPRGDALIFHAPPLPLPSKRIYLFDEDTATYVWVPGWLAWRRRHRTTTTTTERTAR